MRFLSRAKPNTHTDQIQWDALFPQTQPSPHDAQPPINQTSPDILLESGIQAWTKGVSPVGTPQDAVKADYSEVA